jgi:hypothetical protein
MLSSKTNEINSLTTISKTTDNNKKKTSWWKLLNKKFKYHFNNNNNNEPKTTQQQTHIKLFDQNYYFYIDETINGVKINLKYPHLITILDTDDYNDDKTLIKIFPLKHGITTIGSSDLNDIIIKSNDIELKHCFINYTNKNEILLNPIAKLCSIDSVIIDKPYRLKIGN